jgi:hypothetical protein
MWIVRLDQKLQNMVADRGVTQVRDKVVRVERNGKTILAVHTLAAPFSSPWFIDASGSASCLLAGVQSSGDQFGPAKLALWTYFAVTESVENNSVHGTAGVGIPGVGLGDSISPEVVSVDM